MQSVKNGFKSIIRRPGRTALFTLILIVLSALLSIAFCVFASVRGYLISCEDYYHTVVNLEYIGPRYPSSVVFDPAAVEAVSAHSEEIEALIADKAVLSYENADNAAALFDGVVRRDFLCPDPDVATMIVSVSGWYEGGDAYLAGVSQVLYSRRDMTGKSLFLRTDTMDDPSAPQPEKGNKYIVTGRFFSGQNAYEWFLAEHTSVWCGGEEMQAEPFSLYNGETLDDSNIYCILAGEQAARNNCLRVQRTASAEDYLRFHEQEYVLRSGRFFTEEEYEQGAKKLLLPENFASLVELSPGDKVRLALYETDGDLYATIGSEPVESEEYEVVGVYSEGDVRHFQVLIPDKSAVTSSPHASAGYTIGQFRLKNSEAASFMEKTQSLSEHGFRFSLYDHGYEAATEPMKELLTISAVFLAVCLLLAAAALYLECHIFVSRQKETSDTMLALGSGRPHVFGYFISAAVMLAVPAAVIGCAVAKLMEGRVLALLVKFAEQHAGEDLRFSVGSLRLAKTLEFRPQVSTLIYAAAAALLVIGSAAITALFIRKNLADDKKKRKQKLRRIKREARAPRRVSRSSRLSGKLKYAFLSMRRGPVRSASVVMLALAAAFFFGILTSSLKSYHDQLDAVKRDTVINGRATDVTGQLVEGVVVRAAHARKAMQSDLLTNGTVTSTVANARFLGVCLSEGGEEFDVPTPPIPSGSFAFETFIARMHDEPRLVMTSSVSSSPIFYFTKAESVRWYGEYSEADFANAENVRSDEGMICALPEEYMAEHGIELGDTVRFLYTYNSRWYGDYVDTMDIKAVASYISATGERVVYCPMYTTNLYGNYDSFTFTLADNSALDDLRQLLEDAGFEYPKPGRRVAHMAVIDDTTYLNITRSMERQIQYVSVLYYTLYLLTFIIGAVLAYLMVSSRRREIAVMRVLGTQPLRIIMNFLAEQALLCAAGLAAGVLLIRLLGKGPTKLQLILTAVFFACWCVSALTCLIVSVSSKEYAALNEPE